MDNTKSRVLIVDDDTLVCETLSNVISREGFSPLLAYDGKAALEMISGEKPDVMLVDFKMPGINGLEVLKRAKALDPNLPVIMVTAHAGVEGAVEAMRAGASDYVAKPFDNFEVIRVVRRALTEHQLKCKINSLSVFIEATDYLRKMMGPSDSIGKLIKEVNSVAQSDFTVVILGETGSGKELVANALHRASSRADAPFVPIDCGAIHENLLESELFGHEKGAFTGADIQKPGKFEIAHGGTLFLDEISNMPLGSQAKLLRVLQDKKVYRVGGNKAHEVNVRLLAASNQALDQEGVNGGFRKDLFFRLDEFTIRVPPLRARKEDILYLAKRFLDLTNKELDKNVSGLTENAVRALVSYDWPGNVRQLKTTIRRAVLLADDVVRVKHLELKNGYCTVDQQRLNPTATAWQGEPLKEIVRSCVSIVEKQVIGQVLKKTGGNKAKAARLLQVDYKTLHTKVKTLGLAGQDGDAASAKEPEHE